jgi:hypothetical protein
MKSSLALSTTKETLSLQVPGQFRVFNSVGSKDNTCKIWKDVNIMNK